MVVAIDTSGFGQTVAPSPAPFARAPQPDMAAARQRPRRDGREGDPAGGHGAQTFKSILDAEAGSGVARAASVPRQTPSTSVADRPEKVPQRRPAELNADDGTMIYAETQVRQARAGAIAPATELLAAASRYAERVLAASGAFAARGDNLELTA